MPPYLLSYFGLVFSSLHQNNIEEFCISFPHSCQENCKDLSRQSPGVSNDLKAPKNNTHLTTAFSIETSQCILALI